MKKYQPKFLDSLHYAAIFASSIAKKFLTPCGEPKELLISPTLDYKHVVNYVE
jgi:hypothetical protein